MEGEEYGAMMRPSIAVAVLGLLPTPVGKRSSFGQNAEVQAERGGAAYAAEGSREVSSTGMEDSTFSALIKDIMPAVNNNGPGRVRVRLIRDPPKTSPPAVNTRKGSQSRDSRLLFIAERTKCSPCQTPNIACKSCLIQRCERRERYQVSSHRRMILTGGIGDNM
jgi:hypothetical protein